MTDKSDIALDIDALAPPKVLVTFGGKEIEVTPPTLKQYAQIIDFSNKIKNSNTEDFGVTAALYEEIDEFVKSIIPELADSTLNFAQLTALYNLLAKIGAPNDQVMEKLKEQGVDLKGAKTDPKASASAEASPPSLDTTPASEQSKQS